MLENKREKLKKEIENLQNEINEKNNLLQQRIEEENAKEEQAMKDHIDSMKVLKLDNEAESIKAVEILTKPKDEDILLK